ncbi:hypothetical protein EDC01DRAFT_419285 [Geopyxis carbonaria]|nr:hypothetical protein EDC01DRAFT_419285 [Geopyxis carbonaria]
MFCGSILTWILVDDSLGPGYSLSMTGDRRYHGFLAGVRFVQWIALFTALFCFLKKRRQIEQSYPELLEPPYDDQAEGIRLLVQMSMAGTVLMGVLTLSHLVGSILYVYFKRFVTFSGLLMDIGLIWGAMALPKLGPGLAVNACSNIAWSMGSSDDIVPGWRPQDPPVLWDLLGYKTRHLVDGQPSLKGSLRECGTLQAGWWCIVIYLSFALITISNALLLAIRIAHFHQVWTRRLYLRVPFVQWPFRLVKRFIQKYKQHRVQRTSASPCLKKNFIIQLPASAVPIPGNSNGYFRPPCPLDDPNNPTYQPSHGPSRLPELLHHYPILAALAPRLHHRDLTALLSTTRTLFPLLTPSLLSTCACTTHPHSGAKCHICTTPLCGYSTDAAHSAMVHSSDPAAGCADEAWVQAAHYYCAPVCTPCYVRRCSPLARRRCVCDSKERELVCARRRPGDDAACKRRAEWRGAGAPVGESCDLCAAALTGRWRGWLWWHCRRCGEECRRCVHPARWSRQAGVPKEKKKKKTGS